MCGIAGVARASTRDVSLEMLGRMAAALRHRGPDGYGFHISDRVGFAHVRLSIIDVALGAQPMASPDGRTVVTFNGEIFNYRDLRRELSARGRVFRTQSDTEVLLHGWEEWGTNLFDRLNGQFAFALHDTLTDDVILARDRLGVRPLFHSERRGDLFFASEVKALFATGEVDAAADPAGLDEVFTFWSARAPRTPFADIQQIPPGHWALWRDGTLRVARWFERDMTEHPELAGDAIEQLDALLRSAVALRLQADVPVGGYLSGGLDSSIVCALAAPMTPYAMRTHSVTFDDPRYDESGYQRSVAEAVGSDHAVVRIGSDDIADTLRDVVEHCETPLTRTAPVPMYRLAQLTRDRGIKVVLTGEGADETFLGYDLFKEVQVRLFCLRHPESTVRPHLFDRIYRYQTGEGRRGGAFWRHFFTQADAGDPLFSHQLRIRTTQRIKDYYTAAWREQTLAGDVLEDLRASLPKTFMSWSPLARAAWLEEETLLAGYLLSSQGDRMGMAHGVEGRHPFLDHRLAAFARQLPTSERLLGLKEKAILKRWARDVIPSAVHSRIKQPYRAPGLADAIGRGATPAWVLEQLDPDRTRRLGYFSPDAVAGLLLRVRGGRGHGEREQQALTAILTTHLWHETFTGRSWRVTTPLEANGADVVLRRAASVVS
jgi:asparagine synthase (glutamine-hydrolysing)